MQGFDFGPLLELVLSVIPAMICITIHELSHGLAAYALGDDTARRAGRLTLNPIKHIDLMGLAMMAVFHVGWAKPVPIDMRRFKNPKGGMVITAAAGPLSNVVLALVFLFLYGLLYMPLGRSAAGEEVLSLLRLTSSMSLGLAVFNMLPISPLDGSKVMAAFLSPRSYYKLMQYERYGMPVLFALMVLGVLDGPLSAAIGYVYRLMTPAAELGFDLFMKLFM